MKALSLEPKAWRGFILLNCSTAQLRTSCEVRAFRLSSVGSICSSSACTLKTRSVGPPRVRAPPGYVYVEILESVKRSVPNTLVNLAGSHLDADQNSTNFNLSKETFMKITAFMIALLAINTFSFTPAFDGLTVMVVGGTAVPLWPDDCNGSEVSDPIACEADVPFSCTYGNYTTVTSNDAELDVLFKKKNKCNISGCVAVIDNPTPEYYETHCNKIKKKGVDPEETP